MPQTLAEVLTPDKVAALRALAMRYGVRDLRVFGSYARGDAGLGSDLDLLINIEYGRGVSSRLVDFVLAVRELLNMRVDVVTEGSLDPKLHARIFREARAL